MRWFLVFLFVSVLGRAQDTNKVLTELRQKLDSLVSFQASVMLTEDISFVNMPAKTATIYFEKGKDLKIESEDFVMIPKKGLDFTLKELFRYPFSSLSSGSDTIAGTFCTIVRIIPEDHRADFSIATLAIDTRSLRVIRSEISTKKNGVFTVLYSYAGEGELLPAKMEVQFAISEIKIPLRYLGKDAEIDESLRKESLEELGIFYMDFSDYKIRWQ